MNSEGELDKEIAELATALAKAQQLEGDHARSIAMKIAHGDSDIWQAALSWARTGLMPNTPVVEQYNPRELAERLNPSQVFTALMALRRDPAQAMAALRFSPSDLPTIPKSGGTKTPDPATGSAQ